MPKYLFQASYTTEGIRGLVSDSAAGRRADVQSAVKALGGSVEAFYYAFGARRRNHNCGSTQQYYGDCSAVNYIRLRQSPSPNDTATYGRRGR